MSCLIGPPCSFLPLTFFLAQLERNGLHHWIPRKIAHLLGSFFNGKNLFTFSDGIHLWQVSFFFRWLKLQKPILDCPDKLSNYERYLSADFCNIVSRTIRFNLQTTKLKKKILWKNDLEIKTRNPWYTWQVSESDYNNGASNSANLLP